MNVETIQMDPRIARIHYSDYLKKVREARKLRAEKANAEARELESNARKIRISRPQQEKEDLELLSAYRSLAAGQRIINLHKVLWAGGFKNQQPNFAIARADWRNVVLELEHGTAHFKKEAWISQSTFRYRIPYAPHGPEFYKNYQQRHALGWTRLEAIVPTIPVHLRPAGNLADYAILWEAEWKKVAPKDPLLLKQIKDSDKFFVILAQWDLTPLEQQVLEGRFS